MYLLDGSSPPSPPRTPEPQASSGSQESGFDAVKSRFTDIWMKDFHVSPFNSRKGSYALKALNPFPYVSYDAPMVDNTITLKSSKDHAKLIARLYCTGNALGPDKLGLFGTLQFILSWWWVGLVTFPQVLREAFKLYFRRKLNVWYRPEVLTSSIGRLPTASEMSVLTFPPPHSAADLQRILYKVFRDYLFHLVQQIEELFCITFKAGIPNVPTEIIETIHHPGRDQLVHNIEFRVLTPAFYSQLVHYAYISEAIDRECVFTDERNRTLWMCRPQLLPLLLSERSSSQLDDKDIDKVKRSHLDELRWKPLRRLRCAPAAPAYSVTPQTSMIDVRSQPYSEIDNFVQSSRGHKYAADYRRAVTKIFLAERFSLGFTGPINLLNLIMRVLLCYTAASQLNIWAGSSAQLAWQHA